MFKKLVLITSVLATFLIATYFATYLYLTKDAGDFGVTNECDKSIEINWTDSEGKWLELEPDDETRPFFDRTAIYVRAPGSTQIKSANKFLWFVQAGKIVIKEDLCPT